LTSYLCQQSVDRTLFNSFDHATTAAILVPVERIAGGVVAAGQMVNERAR
jgi:hypothetical protein